MGKGKGKGKGKGHNTQKRELWRDPRPQDQRAPRQATGPPQAGQLVPRGGDDSCVLCGHKYQQPPNENRPPGLRAGSIPHQSTAGASLNSPPLYNTCPCGADQAPNVGYFAQHCKLALLVYVGEVQSKDWRERGPFETKVAKHFERVAKRIPTKKGPADGRFQCEAWAIRKGVRAQSFEFVDDACKRLVDFFKALDRGEAPAPLPWNVMRLFQCD